MDEEKIPYTYHSADESPIPVPPVGDAWALMKKELDVKMPVRRWYRRLGGWWWILGLVGLVGLVGLGVVAGAGGWFGKPLVSGKKGGMGASAVEDSGVVVSAGARAGGSGKVRGSENAGAREKARGSENVRESVGAREDAGVPEVVEAQEGAGISEREKEKKVRGEAGGSGAAGTATERPVTERPVTAETAGATGKTAAAANTGSARAAVAAKAGAATRAGEAARPRETARARAAAAAKARTARAATAAARKEKHATWGNNGNKREKHATWGNTAKKSGRHATWANGADTTAGRHARWGNGSATAGNTAHIHNRNDDKSVKGRRISVNAELEKMVSAAPKTVQVADSLLSSIRGSKKAAIAAARTGVRAGGPGGGVAGNGASGTGTAENKGSSTKAGKDKKDKKDSGGGAALSMSAGLSLGHGFPIGLQQASSYSSNGKSNALLGYIPAPYYRLYLGDRIYLQGAVHFNSPQYTQSQLIDTMRLDSSHIPGYSNYSQKNELTLKKLFYTNIPISFHYRVFKGLYLGAGIQYSALWGAAGEETIHLTPRNGGADSIYSHKGIGLKNKDTVYGWLSKSEWRVLFEADYQWRRWTFGLRYEQALKPYMPMTLYGTKSSQRNASYGIHVYYDLWEKSRKKK